VGLRDLKKRWTADTEDLHKESLQKKFSQPEMTRMCDVELRQKVKVSGEIKRIRTVPRSGVPALEIVVSDGTADATVKGICGRRDAVMPRNVQKDPEASLTWVLKDEIIGRGKVYYAKLARGKAMFLAPRMIPYFHAVWGVRKADEQKRLTKSARAILHVLRKEWEMSTGDLREESGVKNRVKFSSGMDELQAAMIVVPSAVYYQPRFTYIWTLGVARFPDALRRRVNRATAVREIARCFLTGAGMTIPGEMARVAGLDRREAGLGNRALVKQGYAIMPAYGTYRLASSE